MQDILIVPLLLVAACAWGVIIRNMLHQNQVIRDHDAKQKEE